MGNIYLCRTNRMFNQKQSTHMRRLCYLSFAVILLSFCTLDAEAQGWLNNLKDKAVDAAKRTIENKVSNKTEKVTGDAADAVLNGKKGKKGKANDDGGYEDEEGASGDEPVDFAQVQAKSDFKRGATVFFTDDLSGEQMGEFPSKWDLLQGSEVEVVSIKGKKAIKFEESKIRPLMKDLKYLPEEFTIELDVLSQPAKDGSGWDGTLDFRFYGEENNGRNKDDRVYEFRTSIETSGVDRYKGTYNSINWDWKSWAPNGNDITGAAQTEAIRKVFKPNDWNHIAISFNKRALKVYLNYSRIVNIPNQKQPRWWWMEGSSDSNKGIYVTNIVMAKGAVELYDRNTTDYSSAVEKAIAETGKFVTNNILFETGKATLKAESMEEIQKVADYMKKNPTARFEVQGHTDNQGSDAINDPLSQQRAEAVVKALEGMGVDGFNLRAVGKGSHEPVADNKTDAGRAQNRRVEFIKR